MSTEEIKNNIKNTNAWLRLLFIIIFLLFYGIAEMVFWFSVLVQVLFNLIGGKVNQNLRLFTARLAAYIYAVLRYVGFQTEEKPFPFSSWPKVEDLPVEDQAQNQPSEDSSSPEEEKSE